MDALPEHRLQRAAAFLLSTEFFFMGSWTAVILLFLLLTPLRSIPIIYFSWIIIDRNTASRGGRLWSFLRTFRIWKYFADYFPIRLHATSELRRNRNYIICYHPHGLSAYGAFVNFATDGTGFSKLFKGMTSYLVTEEKYFWNPLHREILLFLGVCSDSEESINFLLRKKGKGNAVVLINGDPDDDPNAIPGALKLTLSKTKANFCKMAYQHGVSLIPCISFGENDLVERSPKLDQSLMKRTQRKMSEMFKISGPPFNGSSMTKYAEGYLPNRRPVNVVVGEPIDVGLIKFPTSEQIEQLYQEYIGKLSKLFRDNKEKFGKGDLKLIIK